MLFPFRHGRPALVVVFFVCTVSIRPEPSRINRILCLPIRFHILPFPSLASSLPPSLSTISLLSLLFFPSHLYPSTSVRLSLPRPPSPSPAPPLPPSHTLSTQFHLLCWHKKMKKETLYSMHVTYTFINVSIYWNKYICFYFKRGVFPYS
jgi:hypothetical protein